MPEKHVQTIRLSKGGKRRLRSLVDQLELDQNTVLELALKHLYGSATRGEKLHMTDPIPAGRDEEEDDDGGAA